MNRKAHEDWGLPKDWVIDFDMTVFSELQEDVGEMVKWIEPVAKLTGMSPNAVLSLLNLETMEDKIFDEAWIKTEMGTPFSEWKIDDNTGADNEDVQE